MISFYSLTSYQPYNTSTNMERNRPRPQAVTIYFNKQFFAMVFFVITFIGASYYAPEIENEILMQQPTTQTK